MDEKPFLEFNIEEIKDGQVEQFREFHKAYFNVDNIYQSASELKYINEIRQLIQQEFQDPNDEFIRYFVKQVYPTLVTAKVLEAFRPLIKRTITNIINDTINERLKSAIVPDEGQKKTPEEPAKSSNDDGNAKNIVTTEEELEGFFIVKSILRQKVQPDRITYRDALSYFAIFLDDNNRKPICRLYLNGVTKKYIGTFDANKKETKTEISGVDDIYKYAKLLEDSIENYLK